MPIPTQLLVISKETLMLHLNQFVEGFATEKTTPTLCELDMLLLVMPIFNLSENANYALQPFVPICAIYQKLQIAYHNLLQYFLHIVSNHLVPLFPNALKCSFVSTLAKPKNAQIENCISTAATVKMGCGNPINLMWFVRSRNIYVTP